MADPNQLQLPGAFVGSVSNWLTNLLNQQPDFSQANKPFSSWMARPFLMQGQGGTILDPTQIEDRVSRLLSLVKDRAEGAHEGSTVLGSTEDLDPEIARTFAEHPLPGWVERMTTSYIRSADGRAERDLYWWNLQWPDGTEMPRVVFHQSQVDTAGARLLTLEDERVRRLTVELPRAVAGQPVPVVRMRGLASEIRGVWSLWRESWFVRGGGSFS